MPSSQTPSRLVLCGTGGDGDVAAVRGVLDGVADDVHHHLLQPAPVPHDQGQVLRRAVDQGVAVLFGRQGVGPGDALNGLPEGKRESTSSALPASRRLRVSRS